MYDIDISDPFSRPEGAFPLSPSLARTDGNTAYAITSSDGLQIFDV